MLTAEWALIPKIYKHSFLLKKKKKLFYLTKAKVLKWSILSKHKQLYQTIT